MRSWFAKILFGVALAVAGATAVCAQIPGGGVGQSGSVVAGDCAQWVGNGLIKDSGAGCGGGAVGANPSATAGPAAVNGSAITFMRSDAAPAIQLGTSSVPGIVQCDGSTTTCTAGVVSVIGGVATSVTIGTTTVTSGNTGRVLYQNGASPSGTLGEYTITGTAGSVVMSASPTIGSPTITTAFTATGLVTLADLATQAANTALVNATSSGASPTAQSMPSCSTASSALQWTTNTGFGCASIAGVTSLNTATGAVVLALGNGGNVSQSGTTVTANPLFSGYVNVLRNSSFANWSAFTCLNSSCTVTGPSATATFSGYISATTLTITSGSGEAIGQTIYSSGILNGTVITAGSGSSWTVSSSQTLGSSGSPVSFSGYAPNSGSWCIEGVYITVIGGGSITCQTNGAVGMQIAYSSGTVNELIIRFPVEGLISSRLAGKACTFQGSFYGGISGGTVFSLTALSASGSADGWTSNLLADVGSATMQTITNNAAKVIAYSWTCNTQASNGYSVDLALGSLTTGSIYMYSGFDLRRSDGTTINAQNNSPPRPEIPNPEIDQLWNSRYRQFSSSCFANSGTNYFGQGGVVTGTTSAIFPITFPYTMRAAPTVSLSSSTTGVTINEGTTTLSSSGVAVSNTTVAQTELDVTVVAGGIPGAGAVASSSAYSSECLTLDASITGAWLLERDLDPVANDNRPRSIKEVG